MTWFEWYEAKVDPQRAITPKEGETVKERTPLEHVQACLRMDAAKSAGDKRPTLVYFHFPHEHPVHGKATEDMCSKALDDETAARWGRLFRCVQVDMAASDARLVQLLGAERKPGIVVLDDETQVVARIPPLTSSSKLQKALQEAIRKFPERWKSIQKDVADQAKTLAEAKKAMKADDYKDAQALVEKVRQSQVRIGEAYEESLTMGRNLEERIARELDNAGK
jgi:Skp family chaperone for outer membrane proteins